MRHFFTACVLFTFSAIAVAQAEEPFTITVVDEADNAIEGVYVCVQNPGDGRYFYGVTKEDGTAFIDPLLPALYVFTATREGYCAVGHYLEMPTEPFDYGVLKMKKCDKTCAENCDKQYDIYNKIE